MKRQKLAMLPVALSIAGLLAACDGRPGADLTCKSLPAQVLSAQSVPTAQFVPCVTNIQSPWELIATDTDQDATRIHLQWLASDSGHDEAVVSLRESCDTETAATVTAIVPSGVSVSRTVKNRTATTFYEFEGGCVEVAITRARARTGEPLTSQDFTVQLVPREELNEYVLEQTNDSVGLDVEPDDG